MQSHTIQQSIVACALLVMSTVMALAGIDLVLAAIPSLPQLLGGDISQAQSVLATFSAGTAVGLIVFGELSHRFAQSRLLLLSLSAYALVSLVASFSSSITELIAWRFLQGLSSACAAVVAPGIIRTLFSEQGAMRALGLLSSVESLTPAFAPIIGIFLFQAFGWQGSFWVTAVVVALLVFAMAMLRRVIPNQVGAMQVDSYFSLLRNRRYWCYALSQSTALAGLLVYVFGAPTVITLTMGGTMFDFVVMQLLGISTYIVASNTSAILAKRFGANTVIVAGSWLSLFGATGLLAYAVLGHNQPWALWLLFIPMNMGLGFKTPPCFYRALVAAKGNDARASAILILAIMALTALGTVAVAPFIEKGLVSITAGAWLITAVSVLALYVFPRLPQQLD